jgi:hypothetical protein
MVLTKNFKETVIARVESDSAFARAMFDEAISLCLNGEPETAKRILSDLVSTTVGIETLQLQDGARGARDLVHKALKLD